MSHADKETSAASPVLARVGSGEMVRRSGSIIYRMDETVMRGFAPTNERTDYLYATVDIKEMERKIFHRKLHAILRA